MDCNYSIFAKEYTGDLRVGICFKLRAGHHDDVYLFPGGIFASEQSGTMEEVCEIHNGMLRGTCDSSSGIVCAGNNTVEHGSHLLLHGAGI